MAELEKLLCTDSKVESLKKINAIIEKGGGGGLEIGDIGFTQMAIDETKGKRRILNGQLIIQDQYVQFTNIIKNSVALNPSLACTEAEWQTAVTMSTNGVCEKFVIDDEAGTIRLPKYPDYFIGGVNNIAPVVGNGITLGITNGTNNYGLRSNGDNLNNYLFTTDAYGKEVGVSLVNHNTITANNIGVGITTDPNYSGIEAQIKQEQIKGTYFIQVATGVETEDNITNELELINPYVLLEPKFFETEVYNLSWLRANGSFNGSSAVHPSVYNALLIELNADIAVGTTQNNYTKRGLSVKLSTETFTDYDFVLNTDDETFRLPLKTKLASGKAVVGNGMTLGLTNGTEMLGLGNSLTASSIYRLYISTGMYGTSVGSEGTSQSTNQTSLGITTDPNYSGLELSDSDLYLYFYVGETVQNANLINAGRIEEKLIDKLDRSAVKAYIVESYVNGTSGYNLYSNNYCEQWGFLGSTSNATTTIEYLKAFADTNYSLVVSMSTSSTPTVNVGWQSKTATSFVAYTYQQKNNPEGTHWRACGYIA